MPRIVGYLPLFGLLLSGVPAPFGGIAPFDGLGGMLEPWPESAPSRLLIVAWSSVAVTGKPFFC